MGISKCPYFRKKIYDKTIEEIYAGYDPTTEIIKVSDDKRTTEESIEELGSNTAWSIRQNSGSGNYR